MALKRVPGKLLTDAFGLPFTQADVDFVVPDLMGDLRIGIDPFLLFKSREAAYVAAHSALVGVFNRAIRLYSEGDRDTAAALLDFPEVNEIGFGYRTTSAHGSGLGQYLNAVLLETLAESPALVDRGVRHVEEMQLVSLGINADRVSDITANILKSFLIDYTQRQADKYGIPITKDVPVGHVFDFDSWHWRDDYYDLPLNPFGPRQRAIILVPRRLVRLLPWINFEDYQRMEFGLFLRAKQIRRRFHRSELHPSHPTKAEIVAVTRREVERIDHYVDAKERDARSANPEVLVTPTREFRDGCEQMIRELEALKVGPAEAHRYQELMFSVLNRLFEPDLIEGREQVRTEYATEIRDILYTNDSDKPFWEHVRNKYGGLTIVFECKNTTNVDNDDVNQLAAYLGDPLGYLGILLARRPLSDERRLKCMAWYNKGVPHRVLLALADDDIARMLRIRSSGKDPTEIIRYKYQDFMAKIQ